MCLKADAPDIGQTPAITPPEGYCGPVVEEIECRGPVCRFTVRAFQKLW